MRAARARIHVSCAAALVAAAGALACDGGTWVLGQNHDGSGGTAGARPEFAEPVFIEAITSDYEQDDPSLTADELSLYFASKRSSDQREDIFLSTRASLTEDWSEPARVEEADSDERETAPAISADALILWFASDRDGGEGELDVWSVRRASISEPFGSLRHHPELSAAYDDLPRAPTPSGNLLPVGVRGEDGNYDIAIAPRTSDGEYGPPELVTSLNTPDSEGDPTLAFDGLWIFFASDRDDPGSDIDLYFAERASLDAPFGEPVRLEELCSGDDDTDPWVSNDGRVLYFSSSRSGKLEVYRTERVD